jgi:large subunit ribosomal protein L21
MFAIIKTGGKQYRVTKDQIIKVEKLPAEVGQSLQLDEVLMIGDKIGSPTVDGAVVEAEVVAQMRGRKILIFKKKRRHNYRRKKGHRQHITVLKITNLMDK